MNYRLRDAVRGFILTLLGLVLASTITDSLRAAELSLSADELQAVNRLTRSRVYVYRPLQAQDGSFLMVLAPALT